MKNKFSLLTCLVFAALSVVEISAFAQAAYDEAREQEVAQKAKGRQYPGGKDESDLKVQAQLTNPVRSVSPSVDIPQEEETQSQD